MGQCYTRATCPKPAIKNDQIFRTQVNPVVSTRIAMAPIWASESETPSARFDCLLDHFIAHSADLSYLIKFSLGIDGP
jgi:hypothetical protein